jgi:tetratricopeptide (TPR) repeat protein
MKPARQMGVVLYAWAAAHCCFATTALADSTDLWQIAASPRLAQHITAFRVAQLALLQPSRPMLQQALAALQRAGASESPDLRVRVVYGRVLETLSHTDEADEASARLRSCVVVLEEAIGLAPDHPATRDARFSLAVAYAKLREPRKEIAVYDDLLRVETSMQSRAIILGNQAEAFMLIGDLHRAVEGYRAALGWTGDNVLARWGLAVALDRSGDTDAALSEARLALSIDPLGASLNQSNVFFVPDYDRFWYMALGLMARATEQRDPAQAADWWGGAQEQWTQYIERAEPDDPWVHGAQDRRALCARKQKSRQRPAR